VRARRIALAAAAALILAFVLPEGASGAPKKKKKAQPSTEASVNFDKTLPVLGTKYAQLPPGPMKGLADAACLNCHSADIIVQQHLTEKQWAADVTKMAGWGAAVPEDKRAELVAYLLAHFGPDNTRWQPLATRPVGR
jgi:hypothetical protein